MRKMDFLNYVQRLYTNVTIRRGYKWADLKIGEVIQLTNQRVPVETATVRKILVKQFIDIKPDDIKREHDPACITRSGLLKNMREAYPDFDVLEPVTIVTYVREK